MAREDACLKMSCGLKHLREGEELLIQKSLGEGLRIEGEWRDIKMLMTRGGACLKRSC